jgi:hypothetical protein
VQVIHSCFIHDELSKDPILIGVARGRRMSLFRALSTKDLTRSMKKSAMKTRVSLPFGPDPSSLAEFTSADNFRALKGLEDGILLSQLDNLPNCFILHPAVFLDHLYPNAVEASALTAQIGGKLCLVGCRVQARP